MQSERIIPITRIITLLRYPLTVFVIMLHCNFVLFAGEIGFPPPESVRIVSKIFPFIIGNVCVPLFFMFSGYLFFYNKDGSKWSFYGKQWKKRLVTLLLPYILWNLASIIITLAASKWSHNTYTFIDYLKGFICFGDSYNPINFPLWYVRDLIIWVLISPIFFKILQWPKAILLPLAALVIVIGSLLFQLNYKIIIGLVFFPWGAWYSINGIDPCEKLSQLKKLGRITLLISILYIGLFFSSSPIDPKYYSDFLMIVSTIAGCILTILISILLIRKYNSHIPAALTASSFFIYCMHGAISGYLAHGLLVVIPLKTTAMWLMVFFGWCVVFPIFCTAIYALSAKLFPRFTALLSGGRG